MQWDYGEPNYTTSEAVKELFDTKYIVSYSRDDYYRWAVIEKEIPFYIYVAHGRIIQIEFHGGGCVKWIIALLTVRIT